MVNPARQIKQILPHLNSDQKRKILTYISILSSLSILDLLSVVLLSSVASIGYRIINKDPSNSRIENLFKDLLNLNLNQEQFIVLLSVISLSLLILKNTASAFINLRFVKLLTDIELHLTRIMYGKLTNLDIRTFYRFTAAEQQVALTTLPSRITSSLILPTITLLSEIFSVIVLISFAFYASFFATVTMLLCISIILVCSNKVLSKRSEKYGNHLLSSTLNLNNLNLQLYKGYRETIIFNLRSKLDKSYFDARKDNALYGQKIQWLNSLFRYIFEVSILITAGLMSFIQLLVSDFRHAVTIFIMFIIIGFRLIPAGQRLQNTNLSFRASKPYLEKYLYLLGHFNSYGISLKDFNNKVATSDLKIGFQLKNISFINNEGNIIIDDLTFTVSPGNLILIIGKSGSGKSTLLDLIGNLLQPTSGKIDYFTTDSSVSPSHNIAFVSQDPFIFGGTLEENVTLATKSLNYSHLNELMKKLNLVELNERTSLSTSEDSISQWGMNLSGGERQRIAIARALYSDRSLVLMDEPTSSLDENNRNSIVSLIAKFKQERTFVITSHTNDFIQIADFIVDLDSKKILGKEEIAKLATFTAAK